MKKILTVSVIVCILLNIMIGSSFAASNLIENVHISLKSTETPKRLEVSFNLTEQINLSQGDSNIVFEYLSMDDLEVIYKKDKLWSGYLNSYDRYPSGERKYSSGEENNTDYSNVVPAATIYTSLKTGSSIDVGVIAAVRITVLREYGSGESITIYSDGTVSGIEKIEDSVTAVEETTGIRLDSTTAELPADTILIANEVTVGSVYEMISIALTDVNEFIAFEIKLESSGNEILPNGNVEVSIPIPENFNTSKLAVFRIEADGTKVPYPVTVKTVDGLKYATFETDHFSMYALLELNVYSYAVEYYRGRITGANLIGSVSGTILFSEGHQLTADYIATDLGDSWLNAKKPAGNYNNGAVQGGYPVISQIEENNVVKVLYTGIPGGGSSATYYTIITKYEDSSGNEIYKKKSASVERGESYTVTAPAIEGYKYIDTIINGTAPMTNRTVSIDSVTGDYEIIFRYNLNRPALDKVNHHWYITGYENKEIKPDDNLTRAEMAIIFYRLITNPDKDIKVPRNVLDDIDKDAWYAKAVTYLYDYGIISGYTDGTYRPNNFISRAEIAKISSMFDDLEIPIENTFYDVPEDYWAYSYIASATKKGWVQGYENGTFQPEKYVTRAEMITLINKVLERRVKPKDLLAGINIWSDISEDYWAYADIMEATHSHIYERASESDYETWMRITGTGLDALSTQLN